MADVAVLPTGDSFLVDANRTLLHHHLDMDGTSFLPESALRSEMNPPHNGTLNGSVFSDGEMPFEIDLSEVSYPGVFNSPPLWEMTVKIVFYAIVILCALFGNILVIFVVWRNKRMRTTTNYYIVNLAVSDLMVTSSCTWVHLVDNLTEGWILGAFFCKFNSFAQGRN